MFTKTLAIAALAATSALATPAVNVYWGQRGSPRLRTYCDSSSFEYVTVGFINKSPEKDPSGLGYPGLDFAHHCQAQKYQSPSGRDSNLLSHCTLIAADVRYCQKKGKKVLLSIGGQFDLVNADYTISSPPAGERFADFVWGAFGPYKASWGNKPRPFDDNYIADEGEEHFAFDGFDFDIEHKFTDQTGYVAMARRLRWLTQQEAGKKYLITAAPECPLEDQWFKMKDIIQASEFDALFVQFYNNPMCAGANNNFDAWVRHIAGTASRNAKIFIGLPGSSAGAGSGYLKLSEAHSMINKHKNKPAFGGVMIWDAYFGSETFSGKPYYEHLHDYACGTPTATTTSTGPTATPTACVKYHTVVGGDSCFDIATAYGYTLTEFYALNPGVNCELDIGQKLCIKLGFPTTTSTSTTSTSTTSTSTSSSTSTSTTSTSTTSTSTTSTSTTSTSTSSSTTSTSTESSTETSTEAATSTETSTTSTSVESSTETSTEAASSTETSTITASPETTTTTSSEAATSTATEDDDTCEDDETSTSATESATETATITSGVESSTTSTDAATSTSTEDDDTCEDDETSSSATVSATETATSTDAGVTGSSSTTDSSASQTITASESYTTSTIYTTTTYTITSCAPAVTSCPGRVVTETIAVSTTVCPVTPSATATEDTAPETTSSAMPDGWTTSTVYATTTYTITSCAPTVTVCSTGQVTTETISVGTTICPISSASASESVSPQPTPTDGNDDNNDDDEDEDNEEVDSTSTTQLTTTRFTTLVVPSSNPDSSTSEGGSFITPAPSAGFPSTSSGVVRPSSTQAIVTAGAGRNVVAVVGVPAVLAMLALAL